MGEEIIMTLITNKVSLNRNNLQSITSEDLKLDYDKLSIRYADLAAKYSALMKMLVNTEKSNRKAFADIITKHLKSGSRGTFFLYDIREFYKFNLYFGINKGDEILHGLNVLLSNGEEEEYVTIFFSANTFGVYHFDCLNELEAGIFSKKFSTRIKYELGIDYVFDFTVISIPLNIFAGDFYDYLSIADSMLKKAKLRKIDYLYFSEECYLSELNCRKVARFVTESLGRDKFYVEYQEKVNSKSNKVVGLEALARLDHENSKIHPSEFVPIIETSGNIVKFGLEIIEVVFKDISKIKKIYGDDMVVSVNISPLQLTDNCFFDGLQDLLTRYAVPKGLIEFEITENIFLKDLEEITEIMSRIKALGISLSIDDFGTGYSSLKYVSLLPIDVLKIDKSFIDNINETKNKAVVKAMIDVALASNLQIVAEGVETIEQVTTLETLGCEIIQGYIYSKPKRIIT